MCSLGLGVSLGCCDHDSPSEVQASAHSRNHHDEGHGHHGAGEHHEHPQDIASAGHQEGAHDQKDECPTGMLESCCSDQFLVKTESTDLEDLFAKFDNGRQVSDYKFTDSTVACLEAPSTAWIVPIARGYLCTIAIGEIHFPHGPPHIVIPTPRDFTASMS